MRTMSTRTTTPPKHRDDTRRASTFSISDSASRATVQCAGCAAWDYSEPCECHVPEPTHRADIPAVTR